MTKRWGATVALSLALLVAGGATGSAVLLVLALLVALGAAAFIDL